MFQFIVFTNPKRGRALNCSICWFKTIHKEKLNRWLKRQQHEKESARAKGKLQARKGLPRRQNLTYQHPTSNICHLPSVTIFEMVNVTAGKSAIKNHSNSHKFSVLGANSAGNWFKYFMFETKKLIAAILDMNKICYNLKIKMRTEKLVK